MADKAFKEYYSESQSDYKFTLKLAIDEVDSGMLDCLESCLARYELVSASAFKKTPIQESPLDFPNIKHSAVHICEIVTTYPASRNFLQTFIASRLGISEQSVVVYSENDPRQIETDLHLERSDPAYKAAYKAKLSEEDYEGGLTNEEAKALYGEEATMSFLKELEDARNMRTVDIIESPLSPAQATDKVPADYDNFNKDADKESFTIFGRAPAKPDLIRNK